jgi:hypothetical protein
MASYTKEATVPANRLTPEIRTISCIAANLARHAHTKGRSRESAYYRGVEAALDWIIMEYHSDPISQAVDQNFDRQKP